MENNLDSIKQHCGLILESRLENLNHGLHMISFMVKDKEVIFGVIWKGRTTSCWICVRRAY
jgi:hypothetical protein